MISGVRSLSRDRIPTKNDDALINALAICCRVIDVRSDYEIRLKDRSLIRSMELAEQRSEDPAVVMIDAVIEKY